MGVAAIIALVDGLVTIALKLYNAAKQVSGEEPIPTWDEIVAKNAALQAKIDAEL